MGIDIIDIHDVHLRVNGPEGWNLDTIFTSLPQEVKDGLSALTLQFTVDDMLVRCFRRGLPSHLLAVLKRSFGWNLFLNLADHISNWLSRAHDQTHHVGLIFPLVIWEVWKARNEGVFLNIQPPPNATIARVSTLWNNVRRVSTLWNNVGVNTGYGSLLRNSSGGWIRGFFGDIGSGDILKAELIAIHEGLKLA
ncbi:hypothetical protein VNO78_18458 [Psophocarpus tetragonolobus]|uniref:RNase H type-1 domain-containing protein n=1 Tax=Psophocarpus tetragonolobus TaxID=3891 RepID=A0AAN9XLV2_PSOTE